MYGYVHLKEAEEEESIQIPVDEHTRHAPPAVLRAQAAELFLLSFEHRTEKNIVEAMAITIGHLNRYADLLEKMYLKSLHKGYGGK